jgi:hypothetical protein
VGDGVVLELETGIGGGVNDVVSWCRIWMGSEVGVGRSG